MCEHVTCHIALDVEGESKYDEKCLDVFEMCDHVTCHIALDVEGESTYVTRVWLLPGMCLRCMIM